MSDQTAVKNEEGLRIGGGRGPAYPAISLREAITRVNQIRDANAAKTALATETAYKIWGFKGSSGASRPIKSSLNYYGLLDYLGRGDDQKVKLSELALRIIFDKLPNSPERAVALREAALKPAIHEKLMQEFGLSIPADVVLERFLVRDQGYAESAAAVIIPVYKDTLDFARLINPDIIPNSNGEKKHEHVLKSPAKIGDYVQWTSNGTDQFKPPRKVVWVAEDGSHLRVFGSPTGIPMTEVAVVDPPGPPPAAAIRQETENSAQQPDISVFQIGNRLQITADVDAAGLAKLKQVLEQYEAILKLLR
jgi:hypothetical protein